MDGIDSYMTTDGTRDPAPQTPGEVHCCSQDCRIPHCGGEHDRVPLNEMVIPPLDAIETHEIVVGEASVRRIGSPQDTSGWRVERRDGIETFVAPDDVPYVRARVGEDADVIVSFTRIPGMMDMLLVEASESATVKRAARKKRREERELRKRGYDV